MVTKILALASATACIAALFPSCYAVGAASQYLQIISKARPVGDVLADSSTDEKTKAFLLRCADIRAFAVKELGLRESKNYTTYVDPGRPYIADVVQACAELSFDRHLWSYPFVGKLPYKGFFSRPEADAEAAKLRAAGNDAIVRPVDAFSTLGYLKDPLWAYMASYPEANLAETVIHELTHATVFKRGADSFNEELASFSGEAGALRYLEARHGAGSSEAAAYRAERNASRAFRAYLSGTASLLDAVYRSGSGDEAKRARKAEIIAERALEWKTVGASIDPSGAYARFDMAGVNNAYLDLFRLYFGDEKIYADACERLYGNDLRAFIRGMVDTAHEAKDPKAALKRALSSQ
jgi:predicted aminopeptidase